MVQVSAQSLTLEKFLELPETKPASEYIDGQVVQKPMPQGKHSTLQGELVTVINAAMKPQRVARAFPELRCTFGGRSIVADIAISQFSPGIVFPWMNEAMWQMDLNLPPIGQSRFCRPSRVRIE